MQTRSTIQFNNIFRLGFHSEAIDKAIPGEFESLAILEGETETIANRIDTILLASNEKLIELIIVPDRYMTDLEVLQTIQTREVAHQRKHGIGIVLTATDANRLVATHVFPSELLRKIYKISTIRHGFEVEKMDENENLIIGFAKMCVAGAESILSEIVIRACHGAGYMDRGFLYPETEESIGSIGQLDEATEEQSRAFLHGEIGEAGTPEYHQLKQLSIRTQTVNVKHIALKDPSFANPLYSMRARLNEHEDLRHLSAKAYYCVVNPVPEDNPMRMGLWKRHNRVAKLTYPKAVRLISPDCNNDGDKPNHLTRTSFKY